MAKAQPTLQQPPPPPSPGSLQVGGAVPGTIGRLAHVDEGTDHIRDERMSGGLFARVEFCFPVEDLPLKLSDMKEVVRYRCRRLPRP
eukprot:6496483-Prorocentrum_lima.AAC.1